MVKMPAEILDGLRTSKRLTDAKLEALRSFTSEMVNSRGRVSDSRIEQFLDAGYTRQNVLEVVFASAMKTLSNYTNHISETPVDSAFAAQTWESSHALVG
jgi:alkylhydroperoxidase family enzyme